LKHEDFLKLEVFNLEDIQKVVGVFRV